MFGLGIFEIILILFVALIFIGPKKLPEVAKNLGKGLRDFQNAVKGITDASTLQDSPPMREPEHENDHHDGHHDEEDVIATTATHKESENSDKKETKKES